MMWKPRSELMLFGCPAAHKLGDSRAFGWCTLRLVSLEFSASVNNNYRLDQFFQFYFFLYYYYGIAVWSCCVIGVLPLLTISYLTIDVLLCSGIIKLKLFVHRVLIDCKTGRTFSSLSSQRQFFFINTTHKTG